MSEVPSRIGEPITVSNARGRVLNGDQVRVMPAMLGDAAPEFGAPVLLEDIRRRNAHILVAIVRSEDRPCPLVPDASLLPPDAQYVIRQVRSHADTLLACCQAMAGQLEARSPDSRIQDEHGLRGDLCDVARVLQVWPVYSEGVLYQVLINRGLYALAFPEPLDVLIADANVKSESYRMAVLTLERAILAEM